MCYKFTPSKLLLSWVMGLFFSTQVWAQPLFGMDTLYQTYDSLSTSNIPSGILWDRAPNGPGISTDVFAWDGSPQSPLSYRSTFFGMYTSFMLAQYGDSILMPVGVYDSLVYIEQQQPYNVPLGLLNIEFQQIDSNAVMDGEIGFDTTNNKYYDIPGQTPYNTHKSFAGVSFGSNVTPAFNLITPYDPSTGTYQTLIQYSVSYKVPLVLSVDNEKKTFLGMEIDYNDGLGFVPALYDQEYLIDYEENVVGFLENPWIEKEIIIRQFFQDPSSGKDTLWTRIPVTLGIGIIPADAEMYVHDLALNDTCLISHQRGIGQAKFSVVYGAGNNQKIKKPMILLEGFDNGVSEDFGYLTFEAISTGYVSNFDGKNDLYPQLRKFPQFLDSVHQLGYDVIFVDHRNGVDWLERNAGATVQLIQWVNEELNSNLSDEEIVVVGASMGGLISRYAIRKMELEGCCHNVRLFTTFDTPHQGANIPMGIQKFLQVYAYNVFAPIMSKSMRESYENLLNSPGAQQMLSHHIRTISPFTPSNLMGNPQYWNYNPNRDPNALNNAAQIRSDWVRTIDSMGFPNNTALAGITNGSITSETQGYGPGDVLFDFMIDIDAPIGYDWKYQSWPLIGSKVYSVSSDPNNILLTRMGFAYSSLSSVYLVCDYATFGLGWISKLATWGATDPLFESTLEGWHYANQGLQKEHRQHQSLPGLDYCPGSTSATIKGIQDEFVSKSGAFGNTMAKQHSHAFIPTISALAIDTSDLFLDIADNIFDLTELYPKKIPFDVIWYPGERNAEGVLQNSVNMAHVAINDTLIDWLIGTIEDNHYDLSTLDTSYIYKNLTSIYNYGNPAHKFIKQLDIDSAGVLSINNNTYNIGYLGQDSLYAASQSTFKAYTSSSNCKGSWVKVHNSGLFEVGGLDSYGIAYITSGTSVEVYSGGTLRVHDLSRLVIEEGAELIIHPGAIIELKGEEAELVLQGLVTLKPNADFSFDGNGFVRFDQSTDMTQAGMNAHWAFEGNNSIILKGDGKNTDLLAVVESDLHLSGSLDTLWLESGLVELGPSKNISVRGGFVLDSAIVYSADTTNQAGYYGHVLAFGQPGISISNSDFVGGMKGLYMMNVLGQSNSFQEITHSTWRKCGTGLVTEGKSVKLTSCDFRSNVIGWTGKSMSENCQVITTTFEDNSLYGAEYYGQSSSLLSIRSSEFSSNEDGLLVDGANLRSDCSQFLNNNETGVFLKNGYGYFDFDAGNSFSNNSTGIKLSESTGITIENGYNIFSSNIMDIAGTFSASAIIGNYNGLPAIDIKNNSFSAALVNLPIQLTIDGRSVSTYNYSAISSLPCQSIGFSGKTLGEISEEYSSDQVFVVGGKSASQGVYFSSGEAMDLAIQESLDQISTYESVCDDLQACNRLLELLNSGFSPNTYEENQLQELAYQGMLLSLSNAYLLDSLSGGQNSSVMSSELVKVKDYIDQRILVLPVNDSVYDEKVSQWKLDKALLFRTAKHYDDALNTLNQILLDYTAPSILERTQVWKCVCEAEKNLLDSSYTVEEFLNARNQCGSINSNKSLENLIGAQNPLSYFNPDKMLTNLMPNPTSDHSRLVFMSKHKGGKVTVWNLSGNLVRTYMVSENQSEIKLRTESTGQYLIRINLFGKDQEHHLWIITE